MPSVAPCPQTLKEKSIKGTKINIRSINKQESILFQWAKLEVRSDFLQLKNASQSREDTAPILEQSFRKCRIGGEE